MPFSSHNIKGTASMRFTPVDVDLSHLAGLVVAQFLHYEAIFLLSFSTVYFSEESYPMQPKFRE